MSDWDELCLPQYIKMFDPTNKKEAEIDEAQAEETNGSIFMNSSGIFSKHSCGITSYCHIIDAHGIDRQAGTCIYAWWYIWTLVAIGSVVTVLLCFCVKNIFKH